MNYQEILSNASTPKPVFFSAEKIQKNKGTVQESAPISMPVLTPFFPQSNPLGRLLKRFYELQLIDGEGNPNREFNFPPLPPLNEENLDPITSILSNDIVIKERQDNENKPPITYKTNKKLGGFLNIQRQFKDSNQNPIAEKTHLVGGKAKASLPEEWHILAAESLQCLTKEDLALLQEILKRHRHPPRDTDIRLYAPVISREEYRFFGNLQVDFLTQALCEVKKTPKNFAARSSFKKNCLDNFCLYPHEGNLFSIIGFGQDTEVLVVNRLDKPSLWKHSSLEIPLDEPLDRMKGNPKKPLSIQPACFTYKDGELKASPIHEQWAAVFSEWLKILNTKKIKKMNKGGWPSSIVNQVKGYAIKSPTLSDCIYDQMIDSFISEKSSIEEIALLLNKTTINHLGTGRAHFMAIAWTACLRLKGKFSDKELHLLWKQMMKKASEFKQKEKLPPFFSALEKVINRPSISLEHIEDLMALSGLLSLACSNSGLFGFENHLGVPMIRLKTQNLCFNLPFDPSGCLSRISTRTSLHNADLVELCELMYSPQVFGKLSPLEIERPTLTLDFEKWKPYARTFLETSLLKTHGLDLLNLIFTFNPTEEEAFTLLTEVQTLIMQEGKGSRLEQIYHTFKKASQLYPETPYLTDSVIFLETLLQENSNTKKLSLFIRQSSHSPSVFLKKLSSFYIKACQVSFGYTLIDMLLTEGAHNEAAKIMKRLQRENPNRNFNKEWPLFIRLLEKSKDDSHQLIKVGKLALNILELSEGHKDDLSPLLKLIRELWNDPTSLDLGFELFKNLSLKNPSLQENILMEACEKALESKKGISLAFELWQSSSRRVAEKDRKSYEKFCFTLFERLEQYELSEVSNLLKDAKQGIADLNSQNILLKLETIELEQLLKKEDWESALKLIQTISERSRVTELESFDTFLSLLEKCLIEIPLNDPLLSKVLTLFKSRSLEKVLKGQSPDLFSLLSFSLKRMEEECPQSLYLKPLLFLVLSKIKTAEDFSGSAALTLQLLKSETLEIKKNSEKWELLLSHFLQTKQFHSFGLLVVLLYQHKLTYSENIFKDAGQCIKELAALHPKLGFEVFSLLFEKIESPLSILPTLIESPLSFNFLPLFKKLKLNSKSFSLLLSCLVKKKDHQNHYHLLLSYSSSSADWKELLKQLDPTSLLYKKVNLFVLKFSPPKDESPSEQILQVLEGGHDDEMIQLALQCSIKHKVTTLAVWRRLIGIFQTHSTFKGQAHLPSTLLFPLLLENGHPDLWTLFLETSLNLTGRHWFSLMKNLPVLKDHFGAVDQSKRETLYTKLLARALLTHIPRVKLRLHIFFQTVGQESVKYVA